MVIRRINKVSDGIKNYLITWILIPIIVILLIKIGYFFQKDIGVKNFFDRSSNSNISTSFDIGETVKIEGILQSADKFPLYTHTLNIGKNKDIGVRSTSLNLNHYKDKVQIQGVVKGIRKGIPIVEAEIIKIPKEQLIVKNNVYFFADKLISFDFSKQNSLKAKGSGNNISIFLDEKQLLTVKPFACNKDNPDNDCETLLNNNKYNELENFTSVLGVTYYRQDKNKRIAFDENFFGYIFLSSDDNTLLDISHMITFINKSFVWENKKDIVYQKCNNEEQKLDSIDNTALYIKPDNMLAFVLNGKTNIDQIYTCTIIFDLRNAWDINKLTFSID